ncbi:hypothetical protein Tco_0366577 [Tanacetum coccineum]
MKQFPLETLGSIAFKDQSTPMVLPFCKLPCGEIRYHGNESTKNIKLLQGCFKHISGMILSCFLRFCADQVIRRCVYGKKLQTSQSLSQGPTGGHNGANYLCQKKSSIQDFLIGPTIYKD